MSRLTEQEIRLDERRKCIAEIRSMNAEKTGHEWVKFSVWDNAIELAAKELETKDTQ